MVLTLKQLNLVYTQNFSLTLKRLNLVHIQNFSLGHQTIVHLDIEKIIPAHGIPGITPSLVIKWIRILSVINLQVRCSKKCKAKRAKETRAGAPGVQCGPLLWGRRIPHDYGETFHNLWTLSNTHMGMDVTHICDLIFLCCI